MIVISKIEGEYRDYLVQLHENPKDSSLKYCWGGD